MNPANPADVLVRALSLCAVTTATLALMLVASRRLSRNAALRHLGWATGFVLVLLLPLFQGLVAPAFKYRVQLPGQGAKGREPAPAGQDQPPVAPSAADSAASATSPVRALVLVLGTIWIGGAGVTALRLLAAAAQLRRMRMRSTPVPPDAFDVARVRDK